jgi:hypothetical protein
VICAKGVERDQDEVGLLRGAAAAKRRKACEHCNPCATA